MASAAAPKRPWMPQWMGPRCLLSGGPPSRATWTVPTSAALCGGNMLYRASLPLAVVLQELHSEALGPSCWPGLVNMRTGTHTNSCIGRSSMIAGAALNYIRYLTKTIGPRGTMSEGELRAAAYVQQAMCSLGLRDVRIERFSGPRSMWLPYAASYGVAMMGALGGLMGCQAGAGVGSLLSLVAGYWFFAELSFRNTLLHRILPQGRSQNVVGVIPARRKDRRRVILVSHLGAGGGAAGGRIRVRAIARGGQAPASSGPRTGTPHVTTRGEELGRRKRLPRESAPGPVERTPPVHGHPTGR